ncbi:hypothetical protein EAX61_14875 [Dokdonia sinensis]|uniref:DUF4846 domain-containing protein n=1 Tax=Dokdonia sinensis TaxID=2479847 RepID=A0A3M0FUJ7_9FLAO|nr:DUF4846 domain-containing protein [Dokdonia sinensis]RMB56364.1 hypothetical protein EAX61_14875 [Dokdonia sinensis]
MKKLIIPLVIIATIAVLFFNTTEKGKNVKGVVATYLTPTSLINDNGMTVKDRIKLPEGFKRDYTVQNTFSHYIHNYKLKPGDAQVINYDGEPYIYQAGHIGVLDLPVPSNGLQQCADALIRLRAEYLWDNNRKDEIGFKFTSGHYCSWEKYAAGFRPKVNGNKVTFSKTAKANASKANFYNYLNLIFTYAGTYSLAQELREIKALNEIKIGDLLIYPGFPGHVIMIADIARDENGKPHFVFLQGNTPAQSVHLIKNPNNRDLSPWYDLEGLSALQIPTYTFSEFKIVRFL